MNQNSDFFSNIGQTLRKLKIIRIGRDLSDNVANIVIEEERLDPELGYVVSEESQPAFLDCGHFAGSAEIGGICQRCSRVACTKCLSLCDRCGMQLCPRCTRKSKRGSFCKRCWLKDIFGLTF